MRGLLRRLPPEVTSLEPPGKAPEASTGTAATTATGASTARQNALESRTQLSHLRERRNHEPVQRKPMENSSPDKQFSERHSRHWEGEV